MAPIFRKQHNERVGKKAVIFPGQGSQYLGMARDVNQEIIDDLCLQTENALSPHAAWRIKRIKFLISPESLLLPAEKETLSMELRQTQNAQLAVFIVSLAKWFQISRGEGFRLPDYILGHSLGEYTALVASGAMSFPDGARCVHYRGGLMNLEVDQKAGGMTAINSDREIRIRTVKKYLKDTDVEIANYNNPRQVVISGSEDELETVEPLLTAQGYEIKRLDVAGAFHNSKFMGPVEMPLDAFLKDKDVGMVIKKPEIPMIFNYTGSLEDDPRRIEKFLVHQVVNTVRFRESIELLIEEGVSKELIEEIGPRKIFTKMLDNFPGFG